MFRKLGDSLQLDVVDHVGTNIPMQGPLVSQAGGPWCTLSPFCSGRVLLFKLITVSSMRFSSLIEDVI